MRFLVSDDHEILRSGLCHALLEAYPDATITESGSGQELLEQLENPQDVDLLFLDLFLDADGLPAFEILKQIHRSHPSMKILVVSASPDSEHIRTALSLGANGYVTKCETPLTILNAVSLVLAGTIYVPQEGLQHTRAPSRKNVELILTPRQLEVLISLGEGKSNKQIGREMGLSDNTIKVHVSAILKQLQLENRAQAGLLAQSLKLDPENR